MLDFFKYDPERDKASTFNIDQALNQNWEKIAAFAALVAAADLSNVDAAALAAAIKAAATGGTLTPGDVGADTAGAAQAVQANLQTHMGDAVRHVTATERAAWDGKAPAVHKHAAGDITSGTLPLARGGLGATTAAAARVNLDTSKPVWAEVTFPASGWLLSGGVYVQTVACAAAKAQMRGYPNVGLKKSTDAAARELEKEAWALVEFVDTLDGQVKATCGDTAPQVAMTLLFSGGVA